tara:strand:- start:247 stop:399 length:153 start_codon:yes stop_codon:yes gene_type:complete
MDKETLIRLAQPLATGLLAISIISFPLISKAEWGYNSKYSPLFIECVRGC